MSDNGHSGSGENNNGALDTRSSLTLFRRSMVGGWPVPQPIKDLGVKQMARQLMEASGIDPKTGEMPEGARVDRKAQRVAVRILLDIDRHNLNIARTELELAASGADETELLIMPSYGIQRVLNANGQKPSNGDNGHGES